VYADGVDGGWRACRREGVGEGIEGIEKGEGRNPVLCGALVGG